MLSPTRCSFQVFKNLLLTPQKKTGHFLKPRFALFSLMN